jgi:uncharacterized protein YndB with AHSA1/START domain
MAAGNASTESWKNMTGSTSEREIVMTRVFDAPRAMVYRTWIEARHLVHWWGPDGFTTTVHEMDVRPGGVWRYVMHGPDGVDYENEVVYDEIDEPELLVFTHTGTAAPHRTKVTYAEIGDKTEVTVRMVFPSAAELKRVVETYGAVEGLKQTLGRLAEYVVKE